MLVYIDPITGKIVPKKEDRIFFAKAMSGGLRVDDRNNNMKYVIERDGSVTNIFNTRTVKVYDQRNANIIAQRVLRMFGADHPYANYKSFQK